MVALHREFYLWAKDRVAGKNVLEAGCGEGYGASILAQSAKKVVGMDRKQELMAHAKHRYPETNLDFLVMDCEELAFQQGTFDVIVSIEVLEHLENYQAFMLEAFSILNPGGIFICATTNAQITFKKPDGSPLNRNHFQEFTPEEFVDVLGKYYDNITVLGENIRPKTEEYLLNPKARGIEWVLVKMGIKHKIPIRWRNFVRELITGVKVKDVVSEGVEFIEDSADHSMYIIGCGTKP